MLNVRGTADYAWGVLGIIVTVAVLKIDCSIYLPLYSMQVITERRQARYSKSKMTVSV
jgi:hypothetical protein